MHRVDIQADGLTPQDIAMARAEWQDVVFATQPRRLALLQLRAPWPLQPIRISVLRNHAVETTISTLRGFLAYAGYEPDFTIGAYDDALTIPQVVDADAHLIWMDVARYTTVEDGATREWFAERLRSLRRDLRGPMLVFDATPDIQSADRFNTALNHVAEGLPDVHVFPLSALAAGTGSRFSELRVSEMGTRISGDGTTLIAQQLGLQWIPALLRPRLKVITVDLDNTLVGGVVAEDGISGVDTSGGYARLRSRLLTLHAQGLLLALVSKNEIADVEELFAERSEFAELRAALVAVEAGWRSKSESVAMIVNRLGIATDSALIVDDNPGEIASMAASLRDPWFVLAGDPDAATRALTLHPGLLTLRRDDHARTRLDDLKTADLRNTEARSADDSLSYIASLQVRIDLRMNPMADRSRLSELSRKTNQFNTTLRRFSEMEVDQYLHDVDRCVVSVRLRDRLSESGTIGAVFARRRADVAVIDAIAISCRALGRGLEAVILAEALGGVARRLDVTRLLIPVQNGPRNAPARLWADATAAPVREGMREIAAASMLTGGTASLPVEMCWSADGG